MYLLRFEADNTSSMGKRQGKGKSMAERNNIRTDLRVVKTREAIEDAFGNLLSTTPYDAITVTAIAQEARISRKTFYLHYPSVEELLRQVIRKGVQNIADEIRSDGESKPVPEILNEFSLWVLQALQNHRYLDGNLSKSLPLSRLLELVKEPLIEECAVELHRRGIPSVTYSDYWIAYYLGGLCSIYENWKLSGSTDSLEEIAAAVSRSATAGLQTLINHGVKEQGGNAGEGR